MSNPVSRKYHFRNPPAEKGVKAPTLSRGRRILALEETPSLVNPSSLRQVDSGISGLKAQHRLLTEYVKIMLETFIGMPIDRDHTDLQGARAKHGWQAAHAALAPRTKDDYTAQMIDRVVKQGFTPEKSEPFFRNRFNMTTPEKNALTDANQFAQERLSKGAEKSSLADTRFHWISNATFENPDESNQYDSKLEKTLKPFLAGLQQRRLKKELSPSKSMEELTTFLIKYYQTSIVNIKQRINTITACSTLFARMRTFELSGAPFHQAYLDDVAQFLKLHAELLEDKEGCPSCGAFKTVRNDFNFLKRLIHSDSPEHFFNQNKSHLLKPMEFHTEDFIEKYSLYLQEAEAQLATASAFADPCVIPNLLTTVFGVLDGGVRRTPTEAELKDQLNSIFKVATPIRAKRKKENVEDIGPVAKKALKFDADGT